MSHVNTADLSIAIYEVLSRAVDGDLDHSEIQAHVDGIEIALGTIVGNLDNRIADLEGRLEAIERSERTATRGPGSVPPKRHWWQ